MNGVDDDLDSIFVRQSQEHWSRSRRVEVIRKERLVALSAFASRKVFHSPRSTTIPASLVSFSFHSQYVISIFPVVSIQSSGVQNISSSVRPELFFVTAILAITCCQPQSHQDFRLSA
jgi:hypothetical protein